MVVKVRSCETIPFLRYFCFCNALHICNIRATPTYRVYRLNDIMGNFGEVFKYSAKSILKGNDDDNYSLSD